MRLLFCSLYAPTGDDGVSNSSRAIVSALRKNNVDLTVYTTDFGWNDNEIINQSSKNLKIFKALCKNKFNFSPEMFHHIYENGKDFDLIHFNLIYSFATIFGAHIAKTKNIPYVIAPRGNFIPSSKGLKVTKSHVSKKLFYNFFAYNAMINADRVLCSSKLEMNSVYNHLGTKNISYISNGVNIADYCKNVEKGIIRNYLKIGNEKSIYLFLGRLAEEKAIPFLLDVWEDFIKKIPHAVLVLAGKSEGNFINKIKLKLKQLSCPESVLLPGAVTGDLKLDLLRESKCLLLPSCFESFGNVVIEALISGTPVIASIGTNWECLGKNNFGKWLPWETEKWVEGLLEIENNDLYRSQEFFNKSRNWVINNYDWESLSQEYIKLYQDILNVKKRNSQEK